MVDGCISFGLVFNRMVKSSAARLDSIFHALADPTRRRILRDVAGGEKTVGEVARPFSLTLAAVSKHLNVLEEAELIARERQGSFQIVRLNAKKMKPATDWLAYYERFWNEQLNSMVKFLEGQGDA
jgi:DNA-binding transcriptional ArsR family regulator